MKRDLDTEELEHLRRLDNALFNAYDLSGVVRYLEEKTFLKGDRFSFKDHEFQQQILSDTSKVINVQKCAQVGMSEAMARYALAVARVMPYFSVIMTMPFSGDATNFAKTRLDPIINEAPDLALRMDKELDNSEVKGIDNSLLYMRGCSGTTAALSVPADMLIHDELDRSDADIVGQYQSRIKHSKFKLTRKFGTPTVDGHGIALEMQTSMRHRHAVTCNHCEHTFIPDFHTQVKIPGYDGALRDINKYNLPTIRWMEARLHCPSCDEEPSLQHEHRSWICENPKDNFEAIGYYVSPFSVPNVVTVPSLIKEITKYKSWAEFVNQALGETASDVDSQITKADVERCKYIGNLDTSDMHHIGIDVGQICHVAVGRMNSAGELVVVHRERVLLAKLEDRKRELRAKYRCLITVIDAFPETDKVHKMQKADKNLYGAVYHTNKKLATYEIVMVEKDLKEGKLPINQAKIMRDLNFDELMNKMKRGEVQWVSQNTIEDEIFVAHLLDMKRQQILNSQKELIYTWTKSKEAQDHYFHALGYLHTACHLAPTASKNASFGHFPIAHRQKVTEKKESRVIGAMG